MSTPLLQKVGSAASQAVTPQQVQPPQPQEFVQGASPELQNRISQQAAQESAVRYVEDKRRTSQRPPRVEGTFASQRNKDIKDKKEAEESKSPPPAARKTGEDKVNLIV